MLALQGHKCIHRICRGWCIFSTPAKTTTHDKGLKDITMMCQQFNCYGWTKKALGLVTVSKLSLASSLTTFCYTVRSQCILEQSSCSRMLRENLRQTHLAATNANSPIATANLLCSNLQRISLHAQCVVLPSLHLISSAWLFKQSNVLLCWWREVQVIISKRGRLPQFCL